MDGLLIDWGGVLTTSVLDSFAAFCRREQLPEDAVRDAFGGAAREILVDLENGDIDIATFERRLARHLHTEPDHLAERLMAEARPDQAMRDAVKRFHDHGVTTVLVSNSWRGRDDYEGLDDRFDAVVLSQELRIRKPDPRIYRKALELVALPPERCVFVDDLGGNLKPAKQLGMTTIRHESAPMTIAELERVLLP